MRTRLRAAYSEAELHSIYPEPHDHSRFADHIGRVQTTIELARRFQDVKSVADLSCGDATIARSLGVDNLQLGDFASGYDICGPIEETIKKIEPVDLFIISETIEHLDDPDAVLSAIRPLTRYLVLSTPLTEEGEVDLNHEHYWQFDKQGVAEMLETAGFTPEHYDEFDGGVYLWQIWGCS